MVAEPWHMSMPWGDSIWLALALFFVMEGVLPLAFPAHWRAWFRQMIELRDGQIRFLGLLSVLAGAAILLIA